MLVVVLVSNFKLYYLLSSILSYQIAIHFVILLDINVKISKIKICSHFTNTLTKLFMYLISATCFHIVFIEFQIFIKRNNCEFLCFFLLN